MNTKKNAAFSLIEILVALGIAAIVMTSALGVLSSIYFSQKQVLFSHDFYSESRFLMERTAQIIRNNTLDYDRMFVNYGPPQTGCTSFDSDQMPPASELPTGTSSTNNASNRQNIGYSTIYYWDTDNDGNQDRNLGGRKANGANDECTQAWNDSDDFPLRTLYLINSQRNVRHALRVGVDTTALPVAEVHAEEPGISDPSSQIGRAILQKQYAADTDNDGVADIWGPFDGNGDGDTNDSGTGENDVDVVFDSGCYLELDYDGVGVPDRFPVLANSDQLADEDYCLKAHEFTSISPKAIQVNSLLFKAYPNRDTYLAFRIDEAQVHPMVFITLSTELNRPSEYGFDGSNAPSINFQTAVSSRVYGDIRQ